MTRQEANPNSKKLFHKSNLTSSYYFPQIEISHLKTLNHGDRTGNADDVRVIDQLPETFFFVGIIIITEQCDSSQKQEIVFLRSCRRRR